jgi:histidyl-tRNA synthetase
MLDALGIVYEVDSNMVRGLDYYTHTIFEIMHDSDALGTQSTICAGGRYDNLIEEFGGESTPGFGFGIGIERVLLTLDSEGIELPAIDTIDAYVVHLGEETNVEALKLVQAIRNAGFSADRDYMGRKAKAQFKSADKAKARLVVTIGDSELAEQQVKIKNMATRVEATYPLAKIYDEFATVYDEMITKGE